MTHFNKSKALLKFLAENDDLKIQKNALICVYCNKEINFSKNEGVKTLKRHIQTKLHLDNKSRICSIKSIDEIISLKVVNNTFDNDLVEAFATANIPLYKLQNQKLKAFLETYTNKSIHDVSYYKKLILPIFEKERKNIFEILRNADIYLLFDETTDANMKYILNIMGSVCSQAYREKTYLIRTVELSKTNSETVSQEILT
ncbi:hypothetical protein DMUE_4128 [Dictyocoela muelleri]|nr:hypothetical protein DMUE_4128 [Dictyocoela muelleri]